MNLVDSLVRNYENIRDRYIKNICISNVRLHEYGRQFQKKINTLCKR
jgi:hypothetical protein